MEIGMPLCKLLEPLVDLATNLEKPVVNGPRAVLAIAKNYHVQSNDGNKERLSPESKARCLYFNFIDHVTYFVGYE
jgi:hypothetical protein